MRALFVIDMQEEYVGRDNRSGYDSFTLIRQVNQRILQARADCELIIYIKNRKNLKNRIKTPEFAKELHVLSNHIFYKEKSSLFSNEEIILLLKRYAVTQIETIGVDGNCCVASSAIEAINLGFSVIFPCRYIGVKNAVRFCKKKALLKKSGVTVVE